MYLSSALGTYLRAQTLPEPSACALWISNLFHIGSCYVFIWYWKMGAFGAGLAFSATQLVNLFIVLAWIQILRPGVTRRSWIPWNWSKATSDLGHVLERALPCAMLMWAEWWCAEILTLVA